MLTFPYCLWLIDRQTFGKSLPMENKIAIDIIGGSRGGVRDARPPLGVQILSISCSFRENLACSRPPWRVHAPPSGKSWIRHWILQSEGESFHRGINYFSLSLCTGFFRHNQKDSYGRYKYVCVASKFVDVKK